MLREKIRILIYSDDERFSENGFSHDGRIRGGMSMAMRLIKLKLNPIAEVDITLLNRHPEEAGKELHAKNKLTDDLLKGFDELWVFGYRKINTDSQPQNELTPPEIDSLKDWMNSGHGVFVTGDHSEETELPSIRPTPNTSPTSSKPQKSSARLGIGRALGHLIPRARELRVWEGGPDRARDTFNTIEGVLPAFDHYERDHIPQTLILTTEPKVHELFWLEWGDKAEQLLITKFPDHVHEGVAIAPQDLYDDDWGQSLPLDERPKVVAYGRDKRFIDKCLGVVTAYDGHKHGKGRIVADSSFHHYVNENLGGFPSEDGIPIKGSDLDQIAQYYGNLALWLSPKTLRNKITQSVIGRLVNNEEIINLKNESDSTIGKTALRLLKKTIGPADLRRLFGNANCARSGVGADAPNHASNILFLILLGGDKREDAVSIKESDRYVMLGSLIKKYIQELESAGRVLPLQKAGNLISTEKFETMVIVCYESSIERNRLKGKQD
jgi:hypothetical protein